MNYFIRDYTLTIVPGGQQPIIVKNLRITFDATYTPDFGSLTGIIKVYNLNQSTRKAISRRIFDLQTGIPVNVSLNAGYIGNTFNILTGAALRISHVREGPDWITEFDILASAQNLEFTNIETIHPGNFDGMRVQDIINLIVLNITASQPTYTDKARSSTSGVEKHYSDAGNAWIALGKYLQKYNCGISLGATPLIYQLGMNPPDNVLSNGIPFSLSDSNGLIGSPVITMTGIKGRALLTNQIKPFVTLTIKALIIQEQFGVPSVNVNPTTVRYNGDFRSEPWFTEFDSLYLPI